jgi:hypothetical protein
MRDSKTLTAEYRNPLGATTCNENVCSFLVWAPRASEVEIVVSEPVYGELLFASDERFRILRGTTVVHKDMRTSVRKRGCSGAPNAA